MSLYWQQAVQDRNATASEDRNHGKNKDNTNTDTHWQNINLGQVQPNVWNNHASNQNYSHNHNNQQLYQPADYNHAYQQQYSPANNINNPSSIQHTPLLNANEEARKSLQEHPTVTLPSTEEQNKTSSQVTPESTYSVDTFNSHNSKDEKKDEDWVDDWTEEPSKNEKSRVGIANVQPEVSSSQRSNHSGETKTSEHRSKNGGNITTSELEKSFEVQPVAQVAPLVKSSPEIEHPIARVEPVYQTPFENSNNTRRVAPTRPIQATAPIPDMSFAAPPVENTASSEIEQPTHLPAHASSRRRESVRLNSEVSPVVENQDISVSLSVAEMDRFTPENQNLQIEHIGEAQATSTPNDTVEERDRPTERKTSISSVQSGMPPGIGGHIQNGEHSDSTQGSGVFTRGGIRASYQERYKGVKEKYLDSRADASQIMRRLDKLRTETPKMTRNNPLHDISGRRSAIQISTKNRIDPSSSAYTLLDKGNVTNFSQPDPTLNDSVALSSNGTGYGEDFVDASRRSRLNRSRPASRAKSDIGEEIPYHRGNPAHHLGRHFDSRGYPMHPQNFPYHPMGRHSGRMSAAANPYQNEFYHQQAMLYQRPRPQSTYDARSMERYRRNGGNMTNYDAYGSRPENYEDESFNEESDDLEDEGGESEDEMREYNMGPQAINNSFSNYSMTSHQRRQPLPYGPQELYFFGVVRLDTNTVDNIFRKMNVPREYYTILDPKERVAYLYFAVVYNKLFPKGVQDFQNVFKREYYKYLCLDNQENNALLKVCKSMYDEYTSKRHSNHQIAYQASQKQLFSDDRESADGLSDRASLYDKDDDRASDILSDIQRAPLKFRTPHAFLKFGPGGKKITVNVEDVATVYVDDVKNILHDNHSRRIVDAAQNFKGPLIPGRTAPHSVNLYIQNQIQRIQSSEVAQENPNSCDVVDCLLLWRLLETVVKQHGRITGPDIASLLISVTQPNTRRNLAHHREKSATPSVESIKSSPMDPKAYERFTNYLLYGHVDEAINYAVTNGLYADAMVLVRKIFGGDEKKLAEVEARFLATRPSSNPVMTLVHVASDLPAPCLTNPTIDDAGVWRAHAAIVLANLNTAHAKDTVYKLGCVLAKRDYHAAADFCFLSVALLSNFGGVNVFQKPLISEENAECPYVSLIHASLPDDEWDSTMCRFGFSLTNLHATEIFEYAIGLSGVVSPLQVSVEYQRRRLQYAQLLASFGGFNAEAFRYLLSVAGAIWNSPGVFSTAELTTLTELADSLRYFAADDATDTRWIDGLREITSARQNVTVPTDSQSEQRQQQPDSLLQEQGGNKNDVNNYHQPQDISQQDEHNPMSSRSRTESLAAEARDWHADRQEPIQMSPRVVSTPPQFRRDSVACDIPAPIMDDNTAAYQTGESRRDSGYNQQAEFIEQSQQHYGQSYSDNYSETESPETTSHESTPIRRLQPAAVIEQTWEPEPPVQMSQQFVSHAPAASNGTSSQMSSQPSTNQPQSSQQQNTLKKPNGSSGMLSWVGSKLRQAVPGNTEMKLPDDKNPTIRWDDNLKKWVGNGVEEELAAPPPPSIPETMPPSTSTSGGLRAARGAGGSRYFNPLAANNSGGVAPITAPIAAPPMPMAFNFIPTMPDDADTVDPFSGEANPTIHQGTDQAAHEQK